MRGAFLLLAAFSVPAFAQPAAVESLPPLQSLDSTVTRPQAIQKFSPEYSDEARAAELEGTVLIVAVIATDGTARDLHLIRSLGLGLDEKALEAVQRWRFAPGTLDGRPVSLPATIDVDFFLPSKQSYWHLIGVKFQTPAGVSRPVFLNAPYPAGSIVGPNGSEEARLVQAMGRKATVTLSFDVDEHGRPVNLQVQNMSDAAWGAEAIDLVRYWQFQPGAKDGDPVSVPCTLNLVWGEGNLTGSAAH